MKLKRFLGFLVGVGCCGMVLFAILTGCDFNVMHWHAQSTADSIKIQRYDRVESRYLTTGDFAALQEMNTVYTRETRALIENVLRLGSVAEAAHREQEELKAHRQETQAVLLKHPHRIMKREALNNRSGAGSVLVKKYSLNHFERKILWEKYMQQ